MTDLASRRLGGGVVYANDEFFAAADNLVNPGPPGFDPDAYGAKGKVYDGWETRRRRGPVTGAGDHAIVRLGAPGVVREVVIDTAHFTGNYPPYASVEGCGVDGYPAPDELVHADWMPLVPRSALGGDRANTFPVACGQRLTHVRLSIYPDGGVARLRVHGEPVPDPRLLPGGLVDLAAMEYGGLVVECSDMFYGSPANLIAPGPASTMADGWETARRRDAGFDWVRLRLGAAGRILMAELDTSHFKGNAPAAATLRGLDARAGTWSDLMTAVRLQPDTRHRFRIDAAPVVSEVRLEIYPDGGLARLRLFGRIAAEELTELGLRWFNLLPAGQARTVLSSLDDTTAQRIVGSRPLTDIADLPDAVGLRDNFHTVPRNNNET